jgi:hypothetical protein
MIGERKRGGPARPVHWLGLRPSPGATILGRTHPTQLPTNHTIGNPPTKTGGLRGIACPVSPRAPRHRMPGQPECSQGTHRVRPLSRACPLGHSPWYWGCARSRWPRWYSAQSAVHTTLLLQVLCHGTRAAARSTLAALGPRRCAPCRQHPEVLGRLFTLLSHFDTGGSAASHARSARGLRDIACPVSPSACKAPTVFGPFRGLAPWG